MVENGLLKIPYGLKIPQDAQLSILLTRKDENSISVFYGNESFSFLENKPDLYNDNDIFKKP